jgi:hypothetical protein
MANEMYTDPNARAAVLGLGSSPENRQIAANIMTQGLANTLGTGGGEGSGVPMGMPPTPQNDAAFAMAEEEAAAGAAGPPSPEATLESMKRTIQDEIRAEWAMRNEDKKMPGSNMTWGDYFRQIYKRAEEETPGSGKDAIDIVIDEIIKQEEIDADPNQQNVNMPQVPTLPLPGNETEVAAAAENFAAAEGVPPMPPTPDQQGIMTAANGGVVGFNLGGMNQGAVSEEEFMNVLNAEAQNAGVSPDQIAAVTDMATNTTGGPMGANDNVMDTGIMQNVEAVDATEEDLSGIGSLAAINEKLADAGEEQVVHVTDGEIIFDPSRLNEPDQRMLMAALETAGIDPAAATVGNEANILNQMTGLPAFGWFSKIFRPVKKIVKKVGKGFKKVGKWLKSNAGTILGIAGAMTGNPWLAALGSGIGSLIEGKPIQQALLSAGMSFAGTKWVGPWIGKQLQAAAPGTFGTSVSDTFGIGEGLAKKGGAQVAMEKAAHNAATNAALTAAKTTAPEAILKTATENAIAEASKIAGSGLTKEAIAKGAGEIAKRAVGDVASGAVTRLAGSTIPERIFTSAATRGLSQPLGQLAGGAISGGLQAATQPMVEASLFGDPNAEAEALAAWNRRYDYTPSAQELYDFYTTEYIPNQQVDPGIIGGTPGYNAAQAAATTRRSMPHDIGTTVDDTIMERLGSPLPLLGGGLGGIFNAAGGGYVNGIGGPRTDSNLARLSDGEFVMTERAVRGAGNGNRADGAARMLGIMQGFERSAA